MQTGWRFNALYGLKQGMLYFDFFIFQINDDVRHSTTVGVTINMEIRTDGYTKSKCLDTVP